MKNLGIDLGNTIKGPTKEEYNEPFPNALEVIRKLNPLFNNIYIISRVNSEQRERALKWFESIDFFNRTLIKPDNVYFCFDRRDKAVFVRGLNIDCFIDDRPDVMRYLPRQTHKILFRPNKDLQYLNILCNFIIMNDWLAVGKYFQI